MQKENKMQEAQQTQRIQEQLQRQMQQHMQQRLFELTLYGEEIKQLEQNLALLEAQLMSFSQLQVDLESLDDGKILLANLGSKVFVKTKLLESKNVLVNIGSNCVVEKSVEDAKDILTKQISQLEEVVTQVREQLVERADAIGRIETEIRNMQGIQ